MSDFHIQTETEIRNKIKINKMKQCRDWKRVVKNARVMFGELESYPKETEAPQEYLISGFIDAYYSGRKRGSSNRGREGGLPGGKEGGLPRGREEAVLRGRGRALPWIFFSSSENMRNTVY